MNNLKKIRKQKNISIYEMALNLGIKPIEYKNFEKYPLLLPTSVACKISNILDCTLENIFLPIYLQNADI